MLDDAGPYAPRDIAPFERTLEDFTSTGVLRAAGVLDGHIGSGDTVLTDPWRQGTEPEGDTDEHRRS